MSNHRNFKHKKKLSLKDKRTFNYVFTQFYRPLVLFACNFISNNEKACEDIVQDIFTVLLQKEKKFENIISLKSYLYTAVRNSCLNHYKHMKVRTLYAEEKIATIKREDFFLEKVLEEDVHFYLIKAVESLPARCKAIFKLSLKGLQNLEIANQMEISVETVKSQKRRGKQILEKILRPIIYFF